MVSLPCCGVMVVAIVPSSYLAGVIASFSDERLAPSFRRHLARQTARAYNKKSDPCTTHCEGTGCCEKENERGDNATEEVLTGRSSLE